MLINMNNITSTELKNYVHVEDIIIPDDFSRTNVSYNKVRWAKEYYQRHGYMDKPISVIPMTNENGRHNELLLVDEYSRYKAALELELTVVEVKYIDIDTYCKERNV